MARIKLFAAGDITMLENSINEWLLENKGIQIIRSNINSLAGHWEAGDTHRIEKFVFYILYNVSKTRSSRKAAIIEEMIPAVSNITPPPSLLPDATQSEGIANIMKETP